MSDRDVIVIGGGISGLAVADGLIRAGLTVTVLEARARVGGRMSSQPVAGGYVDLGATWFWPGEQRIAFLVDRLGLATHRQWGEGDALISTHGETRRVAWQAPPAWRFSQGASGVPEALAAELPEGTVEVGADVQRIEPTEAGVVGHLGGRDVAARCAVVALPPSLAVATGLVPYDLLDPDLAAVASTIPVWMGHIVKAVAVYRDPFWRTAGLSGQASCGDGPLHEVHDMSGPNGQPAMLFGFGQSDPGRAITPADVTEQFGDLFGPAAATPIEVLIRDWRLEDRTTPLHAQPGQRYDLFGSPLLQRPAWEGRLYWTSTETAQEAAGHIEGALAAAERTVESIIEHLASKRIEPTA